MTGRYKAYPEYKPSDVQWLGDIPSDWRVIPLKHLATLNPKKSGINKQKMSDHCSFVPMDKLKLNSLKLDETKLISDVYDGYTYFENEDVLMAKVTPCFENKNMAVAKNLLNGIGFGSSEIYVLRTNSKLNNQFLFYRLQEDGFMEIATAAMSGAGGLKRVPAEIINTFLAAFPSYEEQQKIANFLDHETAKIDTLITKQEKLIELLKEKRQAVISHAVTKGLNPQAPMKGSGVEWLGEVPEHWTVIPNKRLFELTPKKSQVESKKKLSCSFIPMDKLKQDTLMLDEERTIASVFDGYTYFENEDILMAKVTPCFENKNMVVARDMKNGIGFGSSEIYVLRCNQEVINDFMYYRLQEDTFMNIAIAAMTGAGGLKRVPADVITNFILALPPMEEQSKIIKLLKAKLRVIDELSVKAIDAIELMKERKTALISAAVTGKIDVRDWQKDN